MHNKYTKIATWLMFAVLMTISIVVFYNWIHWENPSDDELTPISGVIMSIQSKHIHNSSDQIEIQIIANENIRKISQKDLSTKAPALKSLQQGDEIQTLVSYDAIAGEVGFIWEIRRGAEVLLAREQVLEFAQPLFSQLYFALISLFSAFIALLVPLIIPKQNASI